MSEIILTEQNFEEEVLKADKPVLVDFWASWCGPCKMLAPELSQLAEEHAGSLKVGKVNVDEQPVLADRYRISSIPALILFENGKPVKNSVGYRPKADLEAMLK